MEMNQLEAVGHFVCAQEIERFEQLRGVESELADVAAALFPFAAAGRRQFDADAQIGLHIELFGNSGNQLQFVELLNHHKHLPAHFLSQKGKLHILLVFISVADNHGVGVGVHGQNCVKLRLGTGFQTDVVFATVAYYLFNHLPHLIHLDRIDYMVGAFIAIFIGGFTEAVGDFLDSRIENIGEAQ